MESNSEGERPESLRVLRLVHDLLELSELERSLLLRIITPRRSLEFEVAQRIECERVRYATEAMALLTASERRVVQCYASGMATREIAEHLSRSANTVANFRKRAMAKMGAESLVDLVRLALQSGILPHKPD